MKRLSYLLNYFLKYKLFGFVCLIQLTLIACSNQSSISYNQSNNSVKIDRGEQYLDGLLKDDLNERSIKDSVTIDLNAYKKQIDLIKEFSPSLYEKNRVVYEKIEQLSKNGKLSLSQLALLTQHNIKSYQLKGGDGYGNVLLTSYYTPVLKAKRNADSQYRYPLYARPHGKVKKMPSREAIYNGALDNLGLELAYTNSLIDNFFLEIQGSGYVDFGDNKNVLFAYHAQNGFPYTPVGRLLVEEEILTKEEVSLVTIKEWALKQKEHELKKFLSQNQSAVFFRMKENAPVKGAAGIPLVENVAIATDRKLIPSGSIIIMDMPILNDKGEFNGKREYKLMVALDVGGAIKGHHVDIYQGIGEKAGLKAGFYKHYGRLWLLTDSVPDLLKK